VVAFHPGAVTAAEVATVRAPVLIHHGTDDHSVAHAHSVELRGFLRAQGTPVELHLYPGRDHGFLAYTRPFYDARDARLAWRRTAAYLQAHLG
jgi:carboxymethylenebutenolidase